MILDRIVKDKLTHIERTKSERPVELLIDRIRLGEGRSLISAIESHETAIIAEIKRRSPSGGDMKCGLTVAEIATMYEESGAVGISVLTDEAYFGGTVEDLQTVKESTRLPVLRKDFIVDEYQIYEAKAYGADAILLIVALLDDTTIAGFIALADEIGLEVLIESHTKAELERAIASKARLIGINNRNLDTLTIDINTSLALRESVPDDRLVISESGISCRSDIAYLKKAGVDGFLIGESLLKSESPAKKIAELIGTCR